MGLGRIVRCVRHRVRARFYPSRRLVLVRAPSTSKIALLTSKATPAAVGSVLRDEVLQAVDLYFAGKIDQWFVRNDQASVVFILNFLDANAARATLEKLPLGQAGLMEFDDIPLGPLAPLALLEATPCR
jgi:hypothetical protein